MRKIDDLLEKASIQDFALSNELENKINITLRNKREYTNNFKNKIKSIIISIISVLLATIGSLTVYAVNNGGNILGIPVYDLIGIKVSEEYNEYKEKESIKTETYNKTSVELVGSLASDYVTILEFDVKLCEEDKQYLRLGETIFNEEYYKKSIENYAKEEAKRELFRINQYATPTEEEILEKAEELFNEQYGRKIYEEDKKYINSICLRFNNDRAYDKIGLNMSYDPVIIDDEEIRCRNYQTTEKISDNEYKVYHTFLLTDEDLKGKNEFTITLNHNIIANIAELKKGEVPRNKNERILNSPGNERSIDIDGDFVVTVSKEKINNESHIIECDNKVSIYKNITQEIEYVNLNPIQTIIKVKTTITDVDSGKIYYYNDDKHNPVIIQFKISDENGNELKSACFETKKTLIRSNGEKEEWAPGDIQDGSYYKNGDFELIKYIIVEKNNSNSLIITPYYEIQKGMGEGSENVFMDNIEIETK